jgi:hypothetical protein
MLYLLLHNNAHSLIVAQTWETLIKLKWVVMEYLAYSLNFVLSDFHLFRLHKNLGGRKLLNDKKKKNKKQTPWPLVRERTK